MKKRNIASNIYTVLVFIFLYMPIAVLVLYSFNASDSTGVFTGFSLKWYKELFTDSATLNALKNTLVLAILSSVISTIIGTAAAYGISKMSNKHLKNATMSVTQIPMINPEIVTGISMMLLFVFVGSLVGSQASLGFGTVLIAHITFNLPYVILLVLPKFKEMDKHLPEAARDLGCTPFQSFFKVELPAIMPGIVAGFIMAFTLSLDDFVISYFTTGSGFETLPIRIYSMTKKRVTPDMYALSTLIFVTILVLLLLSNLASDKNRKEMSKKAKKATKIAAGSFFGVVAIVTVIIICISAGTKTVTLNVYNWGEYISDGGEGSFNVNREFEEYYEDLHYKETGEKINVQVNYTTYASNEDLYTKLKSGAGGYDIIIPSDYMLEKMYKENLIQPINLENVPNLSLYLKDQFKNMFIYEGKDKDGNLTGKQETYGAMYTYGVIGIVYNKEKLAPEDLERIENGEAGWELLYGDEYLEKYKGQILQFNNARDAMGSAMYYLGLDVNNSTDEQIKQAYELLKKQKPYVQSYVMDEIYNKMEGGEATLAAYYAGDCLSMIGENSSLGFYYPKNAQGVYETNIFADAMCIPADAQNKELAEAYINYMISLEPAVANAEYIYYASPYKHVFDDFDYQLGLGKYQFAYKTDENGELVLDENDEPIILDDEDGNPILATDSNGNYIEDFESDYYVIYNPEFESTLADMFAKYAYKDLGTEKLAVLNKHWEQLKVDSASFGGEIYIICAVILVIIIAVAIYFFVRSRKRRKLYWNNSTDPKLQAKPNLDFDSDPLSQTMMVAKVRAEKKKQGEGEDDATQIEEYSDPENDPIKEEILNLEIESEPLENDGKRKRVFLEGEPAKKSGYFQMKRK